MSRQNWAENFYNQEETLFEKGSWSVTEDREKVLSLYFDGNCIEPVSEYNKYKLFSNGFMLYFKSSSVSSYTLYSATDKNPIFKVTGENIQVSQDGELLIFNFNNNQTIINTTSMTKVIIENENQIGFDL